MGDTKGQVNITVWMGDTKGQANITVWTPLPFYRI